MASGAEPAQSRMPRVRLLLRRLVCTAGLTLGATAGILLIATAAQADEAAPIDTSIAEGAVTSAVDLTRPLVSGSARKPVSRSRPAEPVSRSAPSRSAEGTTRADTPPRKSRAAVATPAPASTARSVRRLANAAGLGRDPVERVLESVERTRQPVGEVRQRLAQTVAPARHLVSSTVNAITEVVPALPVRPALPIRGGPGRPVAPDEPAAPGKPVRTTSPAPDHEVSGWSPQTAVHPPGGHHSSPVPAGVRHAGQDPHRTAPSEAGTRRSPDSPSRELPAPVPPSDAHAGLGGSSIPYADSTSAPRTLVAADATRAMHEVRALRGAFAAPATRPG